MKEWQKYKRVWFESGRGIAWGRMTFLGLKPVSKRITKMETLGSKIILRKAKEIKWISVLFLDI